ncbi:MAG: iron-sulfur cluster assembly protein [Myxococcota bacterium]|nr:iron-sulfur cluster assembly protein [Myxococcota bacterium]
MGIRDRIKSKARQAIRRATGERGRKPEPSRPVKTWKPHVPTGPEGHEAMEEVQNVISFADTALKENDEPTGEVPDHVVEALSKANSGAASEKVDTNRLTPHEGEAEEIQMRVVDALREVFDPEIPVNIYDLGLIYDVKIDAEGAVNIDMSLTSPNCPAAQSLPAEVKAKAEAAEGTTTAEVAVVWEPPWGPEMMSEEAKLELNVE